MIEEQESGDLLGFEIRSVHSTVVLERGDRLEVCTDSRVVDRQVERLGCENMKNHFTCSSISVRKARSMTALPMSRNRSPSSRVNVF